MTHTIDLATLVNQLFSHRITSHHRILQSIRDDIKDRQILHRQIMETIDKEIGTNRSRLREIEGRLQIDYSLWLHPRRSHLEQVLSDWQKQRLHHLNTTFGYLLTLRREYREALKAFLEAQKTAHLLALTTDDRYLNLLEPDKGVENPLNDKD